MALKASLTVMQRVGTSRQLNGMQRVEAHRQARMVIVCMGRNDGASGSRRRRKNRNSRKADFAGPATDGGLWYEEDSDVQPSTSTSDGRGAGRTQPEASTSGSSTTWERAGGLTPRSGSGAAASQDQRRRGRAKDDDEEKDEEDMRGWWERPEERSLQAFAAPSLEPWQEERLQRVYAAGGRRKAQIRELAQELDVDRSVVLGWFKEFALRPQSERDAILASLRPEKQQQQQQQPEAGARGQAARRGGRADSEASPAPAASSSSSSASGAKAGGVGSTGFVPFYLRKQLGQLESQQRRIKGEVLRTLEAIYDRTPFPSADVVRGLYELHRLHRDAAAEWFAARRAADGIASSTQKRVGRSSLRERDRDLQGAFSGGPEDDEDGGSDTDGDSRTVVDRVSGRGAAATSSSSTSSSSSSGSLLTQLGPTAAVGAASAASQDPAEPTVVTLSQRDMAALRSSLPSPNKHKGRMMAEKMGVKTGPGAAATQIGNVQYVQEVPAVQAGNRLRASWRYRASSASSSSGSGSATGGAGVGSAARGRRLRLRGRGGGGGGGGGGGTGAGLRDEDGEE